MRAGGERRLLHTGARDAEDLAKLSRTILEELELIKPQASIRRKLDKDLVIENLAVPGHHAQVIEEDGTFFIVDKGSTNGTFFNIKRIGRLRLQNGDQVKIGKHFVVFQDDRAHTEGNPQTSTPLPADAEEQHADTPVPHFADTQEIPSYLHDEIS